MSVNYKGTLPRLDILTTLFWFWGKPCRIGHMYILYKMSRRFGADTALHLQLIFYIRYIRPTRRGIDPKTKIVQSIYQ